MFYHCRSEFGTVGFWGNYKIFLANDEADFVLLNDSEVFKRSPTRRVKFFVEIYDKINFNWPMINLYEAAPTPEVETMFVFDRIDYRPTIVLSEFSWYQKRFKNSKFYYCFAWEGDIVILTLNVLGGHAPMPWTKGPIIRYANKQSGWETFQVTYNKVTKFNHGECKKSIL